MIAVVAIPNHSPMLRAVGQHLEAHARAVHLDETRCVFEFELDRQVELPLGKHLTLTLGCEADELFVEVPLLMAAVVRRALTGWISRETPCPGRLLGRKRLWGPLPSTTPITLRLPVGELTIHTT